MSEADACGGCDATESREIRPVRLPSGEDALRCEPCYVDELASETTLSGQQAEIVAAIAFGATRPQLRERFGRGTPYNQLDRIKEKRANAERAKRTARVLEAVDL